MLELPMNQWLLDYFVVSRLLLVLEMEGHPQHVLGISIVPRQRALIFAQYIATAGAACTAGRMISTP